MAYDERLAGRIRTVLSERNDVEEKRMFGGLAFMVGGHMAVGIVGDDLMVRVGPAGFDDAIAQPHARVMDFTGRPSSNMVYVAPAGVRAEADLRRWITRGTSQVATLPAKGAKAKGAKTSATKSSAAKAKGAKTSATKTSAAAKTSAAKTKATATTRPARSSRSR
jgi:TfoX/Sxy family transcriptional regulator of competence genes